MVGLLNLFRSFANYLYFSKFREIKKNEFWIKFEIWTKWHQTIAEEFKWVTVVCKLLAILFTTKFIFIPPHNEATGVCWFHSVHPSVRPTSRVRPVAPTVLVGSFSYFIHLIKQLQNVCHMFLTKFPNLGGMSDAGVLAYLVKRRDGHPGSF